VRERPGVLGCNHYCVTPVKMYAVIEILKAKDVSVLRFARGGVPQYQFDDALVNRAGFVRKR
jgi:hypothetical protein